MVTIEQHLVPMRDLLHSAAVQKRLTRYRTNMAKARISTGNRATPWRRIAVLGAVLAVPALLLPLSRLGGVDIGGATQDMPIASEMPGENFPGSAFYFLEDAPDLIADAPAFIPASDLAETPFESAALPIAAQPLRITGSDQDHARAQRCMTMALHYEASSESIAGQRAVAQVILNRVAHPAFPSTVCGVVFEGAHRTTGCQFSFACDGSMARRAEPGFTGTAARVAREALAGYVHAPVGLATHYHTIEIYPYWAPSLDHITVIGAHTFYVWRGAQGKPSAFATRYAGNEPAPGKAPVTPYKYPELPVLAGALPANLAPADARPALAARAPAQAIAAIDAAIASSQPILPNSGQVREEYARSGQWLKQP